MDLTAMRLMENRRNLKTTVICRCTPFSNEEVGLMVNDLMTEASQHPKHPNSVILFGHFTADQLNGYLLRGGLYTVEQKVGVEGLPWFPTGWVS